MPETVSTFCRICEVLCGLEADVEGDEILALRSDPAHVATAGFACPKGAESSTSSMPRRIASSTRRSARRGLSPDLLGCGHGRDRRQNEEDPRGARAGLHRDVRGDRGGPQRASPVFAQGMMTGLGSKSIYSSATQDCSNKFAVAREIYGFPFTQPFPDLDHTSCLIVVGANPVVSTWSFLQVEKPAQKLKAIIERKEKVYFVDPRRTESAKSAGEHVFIRPDTDVFFYLGFLQELIAQGGVDEARVAAHTTGFTALAALVEPWTPERCERVTRIPAARLRELVTAYRTAGGAGLYSSTGANMGSNGSLAFWLQQKPYLQATRRVVRPKGEQRDEATIYLDLCQGAGVGLLDRSSRKGSSKE